MFRSIRVSLITVFFAFFGVFAKNQSGNANNDKNLETFQRNFDRILKSHDEMIALVVYFSDHIGDLDKNVNKIQGKKKKLENFIDDELKRLGTLNNIEDKTFLDSVSYYYTCIKKTISKEYDEAITLRQGMKFTHPHVSAFVMALEEADNDIIQIEKSLYAIEKKYANAYKMEFPSKMEELKSNILKNEAVLKYHDRLLLTFYDIYQKENTLLKHNKSVNDTVRQAQEIAFADAILAAEDTVYKYRSFNGDEEFTNAIKQYFKYVRSQYFDDFEFYNEYVRTQQNKQGSDSKVDKKKYDRDLHVAQSQIKEGKKSKSLPRGEILEEIEEASFKFLVNHSPKFK
ncbi:MAG TPA: hypothetical protein VL947_13110 [Cytophagales bacterium]|nr:hypothetical protein [Cytophagales bacterium]